MLLTKERATEPVTLWVREVAERAAGDEASFITGGSIARALDRMRAWPGYRVTPLASLPGMARAAGLGSLRLKDEGKRFGIGSFKPMGGGYAVGGVVVRHASTALGEAIVDPFDPRVALGARDVTVACATDGNHGRAVAWGARQVGCRAVVYLASHVSEFREAAIAGYGADVIRTAGTHDDAVRRAAEDARGHGWAVISETANASEPAIAHDIISGYGAVLHETLEQLDGVVPTHLFVQVGVGGLAAGVVRCAEAAWGNHRPTIVSVEATNAACVYRSLIAGEPAVAPGTLETVMGGLAAGEVSAYAWPILHRGLDASMTLPDAAAVETMGLLARPRYGDEAMVVGESGVAGLAACLLAAGRPELRERLGLGERSEVVVIGTEGATDPSLYERLVGLAPEAVLRT